MKPKDTTGPTDPDLKAVDRALRRAARRALELGKQTGTPVWVIENGEMVDLNKSRKISCPGKFVVCIGNKGYEVSLEPRKLYEVIRDFDAERHGQLRVVDESGGDYLYPSRLFAAVELPPATEQALASDSDSPLPQDELEGFER